MSSNVVVSERIVLKDLTCPIIRLDKSRRRDKSVSFSISICLHVLVFVLISVSLIKPPQFAVDKGAGSIEVNLVAAPSEVTPQVEVVKAPVEVKSDFTQKEAVKPVIEKETISKTTGKEQMTVQSTGGAITEAKPDYLKNPAPVYPESARRRGYEGTVFLIAQVNKDGYAEQVEIETSSGHSSLDEAALKAVKTWRFRPALLGSIPVSSSVRVPVRFNLEDQK